MKSFVRVCLVVGIALAVGGVAGWFAAQACGTGNCGNVEVCKYGNMETANDGRGGGPLPADTAAKGEVASLHRRISEVEGEIASIEAKILQN